MEGQKVKVIFQIAGNYCAFEEMSFTVIYDLTNDIKLSGYTIEELDVRLKDAEDDFDGYCDITVVNAIKVGKKYYIDTNSL